MFAMQARRRPGRVKTLVLAALLLAPTGARAASPEDDYVAARDRYIAELKALEAPEDSAAHESLKEKDAKDLERRLNAMIGSFALTGFPAEGKLNPDLYETDAPLGNLDGLAYYFDDKAYVGDASRLLITTDGLLDKWLLHHPRRESDRDLPRSAVAAVRSDAFYSQALSKIAPAVARYAIIPILAPPGAKFATAMLATTDVGPEIPDTPDRLFVALEKGGRVFIVSARPATPIKGIAACDALLGTYDKKADAAEKATARTNDPKSQDKLGKLADKFRSQGQAAFLTCFNDKMKTTPEFEAATKQAAAIVEALARN
ncbi:hypothetical protein [Methylocapsa sp. S129]|uniref:hypothetical protein n=1 Tax=Methylocapsa sp. S129 TaxID=1641869 RepID=UPI00131A6BE1|nr:hypothetical protein [Methylocapsa sp. S129]